VISDHTTGTSKCYIYLSRQGKQWTFFTNWQNWYSVTRRSHPVSWDALTRLLKFANHPLPSSTPLGVASALKLQERPAAEVLRATEPVICTPKVLFARTSGSEGWERGTVLPSEPEIQIRKSMKNIGCPLSLKYYHLNGGTTVNVYSWASCLSW
jgi:hypothetical protein